MLGTFALTSGGLAGGLIQNVNHGITTGALFLLVGMIYDRRHTKKIADFGGLARAMPIFAGVFLFTTFASIGLPGLNGFIGEFMVLMGSFPTLPVHTIVAASGVVLASIYLLWAYERAFTGVPDKPENQKPDRPELAGEAVARSARDPDAWLLGLYPKVLLDRVQPSAEAVLDRIEASTDYVVPEPGRIEHVLVMEGGE